MNRQLQKLTLFYDGLCPLCLAEIRFLSRRNQEGLLDFIDINSGRFDAGSVGVSCEQALAAMYGQFADGHLIQGPAVFAAAYERARLPFLAWFFSRKSLQPMLQRGYQFFARNRHKISKLVGPSALWLESKTNMTNKS